MATRQVLIAFDDLTDVVSAYFADTRAEKYGPAPDSGRIMLELDATGAVIGIEIIGASHIVPSTWQGHSIRTRLPSELLTELDMWVENRARA